MNVYDFDRTIYDGDSTIDFYFFALKRNLSLLRYCIPQVTGLLLYVSKRIDKTKFKERFFCFLQGISNTDVELKEFWRKHKGKIMVWYKLQKCSTDVIISASPEFLLKPICGELEVGCLIASRVDVSTGKFSGLNCYGKEKVVRFREIYRESRIDRFYSDSHSDDPIAFLADQAFIVSGNTIHVWE